MRIFLSYASDQKNVAEPIAFSLRGRGHKVFLDKDDLPAGASYDDQIEKAIDDSDIFLFLISPAAVAKGRFTMTELAFARKKWPVADRNILPVMIAPTEYKDVPNYLKAVTVLEPMGNVAAEVASAVEQLRRGVPAQIIIPAMAGLGLLSGLASGIFPNLLPDISTGGSFDKALFVLNEKEIAPLHVAAFFALILCGALRYWQKATLWPLVACAALVFVGWLLAHNTSRHSYTLLSKAFSLPDVTGAPEELANALRSQNDIISLQVKVVVGMIGGLVGALLTYIGARIACVRLSSPGTAAVVVGVGAVLGSMLMFVFGGLTVLFVCWQAGVAAAIGYGLSRPAD